MATQTIPVTITPEASARAAELGLQSELETIIDHTRQSVADLAAIEVTRYDDPEEPEEPRITIMAWQRGPWSVEKEIASWEEWTRWFITAYPPDVLRWIGFHNIYREDHER